MALGTNLKNYLANYQKDYDYRHRAIVASFDVDELALSVGRFYEKIRKVIDWKEENALRRGAIARAFKRNLAPAIFGFNQAEQDDKVKDLAETMVFELMRSGYFDNNLINAEKVEVVTRILQKYVVILNDLNKGSNELSRKDLKVRIKLQNWVIQIVACEIEECLAPAYRTYALVALMREVLANRIRLIPTSSLDEQTQQRLLLIAIWRSLYEADDYFISYELLKIYHPDFLKYELQNVDFDEAEEIFTDKKKIDADLNSKIGRSYLRIANKYDAAYRLVGELSEKTNPSSIGQAEEFFENIEKVKTEYTAIYQDRYKNMKARLLKTAFWTTLSILIANSASVVILEWPVAELMGLDFGWMAIAADILIPTVAMFVLVMLIRLPRSENEAALWLETQKVIYEQPEKDTYEIRSLKRTNNKALQAFFFVSTIVAGAVGLFALYKMFEFAGLPWTSIYLNVVYITMVLFATLSIRQKAQELTVFERTSLFDFVLDVFSIPLARIGQWFSRKWKEYNIFSVIFSILIDAPLSLFIGFLEDWRNFLKENKSEIR